MIDRGLVPLLDIAYQGFDRGLEEDAFSIRLFAESGISFLVSSSFSKSFSLYGERVGGLTVVCQNADEAARVLSQVKQMARANYSNPPNYGASLGRHRCRRPGAPCSVGRGTRRNARPYPLDACCPEERDGRRRLPARLQLRDGSGRHVLLHGFTPEQVERLKKEYGIYAVANGRICIAGLNNHNVQYVAKAFTAVQKN